MASTLSSAGLGGKQTGMVLRINSGAALMTHIKGPGATTSCLQDPLSVRVCVRVRVALL